MASRRSHKPKNTGSSPVSATNYGAVAQLGERLSCTQEVTSSTLVSSTIMFPQLSWLEHLLDMQKVAGSNPAGNTKKRKHTSSNVPRVGKSRYIKYICLEFQFHLKSGMVGSTPTVKFIFDYDTTSVLEDWANWNFVFRGRIGCENFQE